MSVIVTIKIYMKDMGDIFSTTPLSADTLPTSNDYIIDDVIDNSHKLWIERGYNRSSENLIVSQYDMDNIKFIVPTSNIKCWWCTLYFPTSPIGIPYQISVIKNKNIYHTHGCFCSFKCANSYNYYNLTEYDKFDTETLLFKMYLESGFKMNSIGYAPRKELMIQYGGKISIDNYRDLLKSDKIIKYKLPPYKSLNPTIEVCEYNVNKIPASMLCKKYRIQRPRKNKK